MNIRTRARALTTALTTIAACAVAACASAPQQNAVGPSAPGYEATITRTRFGIPHIKAEDFGGLGFGSAYARAQDNLCLMAEIYVSVAGERSKYFGANGKTLVGLLPATNIDSDVFHRMVTDLQALHAAFSQRSADYQALVDGWVVGYNRFLKDNAGQLPAACAGQPWVREITRDDVLRSINSFSTLASSSAFATQIANAAPPADTTAHAATSRVLAASTTHEIETLPLGSNGWAFGGDATRNGKGLVLANPHFPWAGPNRFYETHLSIPGKFDVAGAAIMNLPFVGIGFNRDIAWTHTVDMAAHMTLFKLSLAPDDPTAYVVDGQREAMTRRDISIENKDGAPIVRSVYASRFGPMISLASGRYAWTRQVAYAVADANNGNIRSGDTYLALARAHSVEQVRDALAVHLGVPFVNTMAADRSGKALYADITAVPNVSAQRFADCGKVEDRLPGHLQDLYVLDGSRSACDWERSDAVDPKLLPASQMATLYRRDYVQNSNDSYRWSNPEAPMKLAPIMGRDPGLGGLRTRSGIQEIRSVLRGGKFDADLAAQTMFGNKVLAAELALPALLKLCKRREAPAEACAALSRWDGKAELESRGAMLFNLFWGKVGARPDIWKVAFDPDDPTHTPRDLVTEGKPAEDMLAALKAVADDMKKLGVSLDAPLGAVQFAERGNERIPISGLQFGGILNYTKTVPATAGYSVIFGASYVQAVSFDEQGPVANAVLTYSQSSDPASPHYADQTREFSKKQLHRFPFSDAEIAADALGEPMTLRQ